jgi:hypothetical protein
MDILGIHFTISYTARRDLAVPLPIFCSSTHLGLWLALGTLGSAGDTFRPHLSPTLTWFVTFYS